MADQARAVSVKRNTWQPQGRKTMRFDEYFKSAYYLLVILGYNFFPYALSKSIFVRFIFPIYSVSVSIGLSYLALNYVKYVDRSPYIFVAAEYVATVILLLFVKADKRAQFIKNLEVVDEKLHINASYYDRLKKFTYIVFSSLIFTRIIFSTAVWFLFKVHESESPMIIFFSGFILIAVDTNQVPRLILFHMINHRMSLLRKRVEGWFQNDKLSVINSKNIRKGLAEYQDQYENILGALDLISPQANLFFLVSLVCCFPKIMFLLYNIIVVHQRGAPLLHLLVLSVEAIQWGLIPCLPGITIEMTRAQVDKMKLFLLQGHKDCNDIVIRAEIKDFLDYIELRPCRYYLYRLIPVDVTLPVSLFNLCTTYFIVMIQFSHLFDDIG